MTGMSTPQADAIMNNMGALVPITLTSGLWLGLVTAVGVDAGTGFTEVSGGSYARAQVAGSAATNGTTASGNPTLHFASTPAWVATAVTAGYTVYVTDTTAAVIPASTTVLSTTGTTAVMSANATGGGVGSADNITFSLFNPANSAVPALLSNAGTIALPTSSGAWGTIIAFVLVNSAAGAISATTLQNWDYLGNFAWAPFTCTSATPGVLTSPAHGYSNGDQVVVTAEYGGTLPTTGGSFAGLLTVANVTTDTFTVGVNTTGTGDGMVRKVVPLVIGATPTTVTFSGGSPGNLQLTLA